MALVEWSTYYKKSGDVFYNAVIPLTAGDHTDIIMPKGTTGLLMSVAYEGDVTFSIVDATGASEVETIFDEETDGVGGIFTFAQIIVQDSDGVNFRILDTSGGSQDIAVSVRAITK